MEKNNMSLISFFFNHEINNYLLLEKSIFELYEICDNAKKDDLIEIIKQNIIVAKDQISILLEVLSHQNNCKDAKELEKDLNERLNDLVSLEECLKRISNNKDK